MAIPTTVIRTPARPVAPRVPTTSFTTVSYPNRPKPAPRPVVQPPRSTWGPGLGGALVRAGASPGTPPLTPGTSGTTTAPAQQYDANGNPIDSIYTQNVAAHSAGVANQIAGWNRQISDLGTALGDPSNPSNPRGTTLGELSYKQPLDVLAAQIAANRTGGLASTSLGQHLGAIGQNYTNLRAKAISDYNTAVGSLAGQIAAAQTGDIEYGGGQLEDAAIRASQAAQTNPALAVAPSVVPNRTAEQRYLAPGASLPAFTLTRPANAPANARWSGGAKPAGNWRGIGGGWWVPR